MEQLGHGVKYRPGDRCGDHGDQDHEHGGPEALPAAAGPPH